MEELVLTSLEEVLERTKPQLVQLSGWGDGEPFVARLQRVEMDQAFLSISNLPNPVLSQTSAAKGTMTAKEILEMVNKMAKSALVEPDPEVVFPRLTLMQKIEIMNWELGEVSQWESFREKPEQQVTNNDIEQALQSEAVASGQGSE